MKNSPSSQETLEKIYKRLFAHFGPQHWWPGETSFEIAVGAILAQNTSWNNASRAIENLKKARLLNPKSLRQLPIKKLAQGIRSSGYFNQKARKLKMFLQYLQSRYGGRMGNMQKAALPKLREELLKINGIGPETADSILLYALHKPIFVVDAYTKRVLARHSLISWNASYDEIQGFFLGNLPKSVRFFNEYHALIVALGKKLCHKTYPKCNLCPLASIGKLQIEPSSRQKKK